MDLRQVQEPLKEKSRNEPGSSWITLKASGSEAETPISCSVDIGRVVYEAEAHTGVGGAGTAACSGDLLLGALAACAQITCQMVASAVNIPTQSIGATAEGDLDLAGILGVSKEARVGFENIRLILKIDAPEATPEQIDSLCEKTEQYCVVMQTLKYPPNLSTGWVRETEDATE
jgi:uncharacterized OsmC-like protein